MPQGLDLSLKGNVCCRFYVVLAFAVIIVASIIGIFLPLWEARDITRKVPCCLDYSAGLP